MGSCISWSFFHGEGEEVAGLLESLLVCKLLEQGHDGQGAPMEAERTTSIGQYHAGCIR